MISDPQTFGTHNKDQQLSGNTDYQLLFYSAPSNPATEPGQAGQLLDPADPASAFQAAFLRVVVASHEIDRPLAAAIASLIGDAYRFASVHAEAAAGFTLTACDILWIFFCLPQPGLNVTEGQMIKKVNQGAAASNGVPVIPYFFRPMTCCCCR